MLCPVGWGTIGWMLVNVRIYFWTIATCQTYYMLYLGWKWWVWNNCWLKWELSWLTIKALQNWLPPPPREEHLQNWVQNDGRKFATSVVLPTTWQRIAYRIVKRDWTVWYAKSLRSIASDVYSIAVLRKCWRGEVLALVSFLNTKKFPSIKVCVDGQECTALIDSRCSQTLVMCRFWKQKSGILTSDGRALNCWGNGRINVEVGQILAVIIVLVMDSCWAWIYCWDWCDQETLSLFHRIG